MGNVTFLIAPYRINDVSIFNENERRMSMGRENNPFPLTALNNS